MSFNRSTSATRTTILYLCLSLFCLPIFIQAYDPVDSFTINCGSTGETSDGERSWVGDINSMLLSTKESQTVTAQANTQGSSVNQVPYTTARLSRSEFGYSFPVTAGQKFVRLFFYPASYSPGFDRSNAFFTVKSGGFTLLKDFNASLNADVVQIGTILKEYVVNVGDEQRINLTFTPNSSLPNSYAFVNGIEVLSMPTDLYYSSPSSDQGIVFVGTGVSFSIGNSSALETDYRIKVGGQTITPKNDTGMLRLWEKDDAYLRTPFAKLSLYRTSSMNITVNPDYVAPKDLYRTSRDMGRNGDLNKVSNLTWEFSVDTGFTYMLRLHFCELDPNISVPGDRLFIIYIAGEVADSRADVLQWSIKKGIAVHRDFAVLIPQGNQKKVNLSLQLQPSSEDKTAFSDPFLNGLEIFKISDPGSNNLAGPNPDLVPQTPSNQLKTRIGIILGVVGSVVLLFVLALFLRSRRSSITKISKKIVDFCVVFTFFLKRRKSETEIAARRPKKSPFSFTESENTQTTQLPSHLCRHFSLAEMRAATNNFDELLVIGVGGFGNVYKGYIDGGATPVAIKRLRPGSQQGAHEFRTEIEMLSQLRHLHLVSLIGCCCESNEMIVVYEFMDRGTLRDHLYNTDKNSNNDDNNSPLSWKQRLGICIGVARGLHYLHTGAVNNVIHRDVKSTNILLNQKWVPKVSDFGLSKHGPTGISRTHISTMVKGSFGYLDPEYFRLQRLTLKSDVYSFGVVLLEVLCGRPPIMSEVEKQQTSLAYWGRYCYDNGTLDQIVDPSLKGEIAHECLSKFGETAVSCLLDDASQRPSMNDVVGMLEFALQLQESDHDEIEQNDHNTSRIEVTEERIGDTFNRAMV